MSTNDIGRPKTRKGFSAVPFFGDLVALWRLLRDPGASWGVKLFTLAALLYVVCPVDALPEALAPAIGWLDDVGLVLFMRLVLSRKLEAHRYPLFEQPARLPEREVVEARVVPVRG